MRHDKFPYGKFSEVTGACKAEKERNGKAVEY